MRRTVWTALTLAAGALNATERGSIEYPPPAFLTGPVVAHSMLGVTYAYHSKDTADHAALQISIVTIPREMKRSDVSPEHCIALFMTEVARGHRGFFAVQSEARLEAGPLRLTQVRWTAKDSEHGITGVTSCAVDKGRYISINFQDAIKTASDSFPEIRASIKNLKIGD
jgi:hypothetical protein